MPINATAPRTTSQPQNDGRLTMHVVDCTDPLTRYFVTSDFNLHVIFSSDLVRFLPTSNPSLPYRQVLGSNRNESHEDRITDRRRFVTVSCLRRVCADTVDSALLNELRPGRPEPKLLTGPCQR